MTDTDPKLPTTLAEIVDAALLENFESNHPELCRVIRQLVAAGRPRSEIASKIGQAAPATTITYHAAILILDTAIARRGRPGQGAAQ